MSDVAQGGRLTSNIFHLPFNISYLTYPVAFG